MNDDIIDALAFFSLIFILFAIPIGAIAYDVAYVHSFGGYGVVTEKWQNESGCFVKIPQATYEIDPQLYKGVLVGTAYDYSGANNKITNIMPYAEDSGL